MADEGGDEDSTGVPSVKVEEGEAVESSSSSGVGAVVVVVVGFGIVLSLLLEEEPPGRNLLRMPVVEEDLTK